MPDRLLRLFPTPCVDTPLNGLYLTHRVNRLGTVKAPFVYANFLSSLDGRIAVEDTVQGTSYIPKHLTTDSDFRLFMELHAQADCLITHGGYLRALHEKRLGNILQVGLRTEHRDLAEWRAKNGLKPQPAVIVASASLDFPIPPSIAEFGQEICIATGKLADPERIAQWRNRGYKVLLSGDGRLVQGAELVRQLGAMGFKSVYLIAGPNMLDTVVREGVLCRLYHTITHQLVGGEDIHTLLPGPMLGREGNLVLRSLYYDDASPQGSGQFFAQFEPSAR